MTNKVITFSLLMPKFTRNIKEVGFILSKQIENFLKRKLKNVNIAYIPSNWKDIRIADINELSNST